MSPILKKKLTKKLVLLVPPQYKGLSNLARLVLVVLEQLSQNLSPGPSSKPCQLNRTCQDRHSVGMVFGNSPVTSMAKGDKEDKETLAEEF